MPFVVLFMLCFMLFIPSFVGKVHRVRQGESKCCGLELTSDDQICLPWRYGDGILVNKTSPKDDATCYDRRSRGKPDYAFSYFSDKWVNIFECLDVKFLSLDRYSTSISTWLEVNPMGHEDN